MRHGWVGDYYNVDGDGSMERRKETSGSSFIMVSAVEPKVAVAATLARRCSWLWARGFLPGLAERKIGH